MKLISAKFLRFAVGLLGFAVRAAASFLVCQWLYVLAIVTYDTLFVVGLPPDHPLGGVAVALVSSLVDAHAAIFEIGSDDGFAPPQPYQYLACIVLIAMPIAFVWAKVCRRRCGPASEWF